jgi:prevent-host-death family protein
MNTVNALEIRNHLGQVLDRLESTGEPILVSKGRRVRAVLITPEDFERRFLDRQAEEKRGELIERIRSTREPSRAPKSSLELLRQLRGYSS